MAKFSKTDLLNALALHNDIKSKSQAIRILDFILGTVATEVASGNKVYLGQNFGGFSLVERAPKTGTAMGVTYSVPARKAVKFKPSTAFRDAVRA